ncbi:MAG: PQQ-binding-like beta-propeller repeat protein, partial [Planctomycetales bacterium]
VSVDLVSGGRLPYAENMVNFLIVENPSGVSMEEINRVLAPQGTAYSLKDGKWSKTTKQRPKGMDEWTHFLHGPDNNAVARDVFVGPPRHIRWQGLPKFARAHEQLASFSACVTAGGRMFYIVDEAGRSDVRLDSQWFLIARDAFSGVILWKKPLGEWADKLRRFRAGPAHLLFRVVASREHLFVTMGIESPVSVLETATGNLVRVIKGSEFTKQIIHEDGTLALLIDLDMGRAKEIDAARRRGEFLKHRCRVVRADVATGEITWKSEINDLVFPCMALSNNRLFYQTPAKLQCLDFKTGEPTWSEAAAMSLPVSAGKAKTGEIQWEAPTLVVDGDHVMVSDFKSISAYAVKDGKRRWTAPASKGYNAPADVLVINELIWTKGRGNERNGLDPSTGETKRTIKPSNGYMHPRCYRNKATEKFILLGEMGVQFVDVETGEVWRNHWIRGVCQFGILPANGLLYVTPDSCACNMKTKLSGLYALSHDRSPLPKPPADRLEKGPAYADAAKLGSQPNASSADWPTFRHDPMRTGITSAKVSPQLAPSWKTDLGGKLTGVTVSDGKVFVASIESHAVHALDAKTGKKSWTYITGGRVDSPPTIHKGLALFGSADGWIYAVRASDGELAWRFLAAPEDRRVYV